MAAPEQAATTIASGNDWFRTTHWTVVLGAIGRDADRADAALAQLCQVYWQPIYSYIRRSNHSPEDAKDLTQSFFARLLEKGFLKSVDRDKGKFRSFLLMILKRFLANEWDRANRLKRGGGREIFSLDEVEAEARYQADLVDDWTPERAFEQRWAETLLEQVINDLAQEMAAHGKQAVFDALRVFLTGEASHTDYGEAARRLGMTEGNLRVTIHRLRQRYRELLRLEIGHTVQNPDDINDEIRHLFAAAR